MERLTLQTALARLAQDKSRQFVEVFAHGSLLVEVYKPDKIDRQTVHSRDEVYVVISGNGEFVKEGVKQPFEAGEVLFAAAGEGHRFENFTDDFATWVFFYGPARGEPDTT